MASDKERLSKAMEALRNDKKDTARILLSKVADSFASKKMHSKAAGLYEKVAILAEKLNKINAALRAIENATLMYIRIDDDAAYEEIVRLNLMGAKMAERNDMFERAKDSYFRAIDFVASEKERDRLTGRAADALENLADIYEENGDLEEAVSTLKKVGRLYYSAGDPELGTRIHDRAAKVAIRWANEAKDAEDYLAAGNALAEAAQIIQNQGDMVEAARQMIEAGEYYERAELYEKAGNIYDAAKEAYDFERLTSATNKAKSKAAEAYMKMEGKPQVLAPLLVKAGDLFSELDRVMKAKWAYKRASELFEELAKNAEEEGEIDSEKTYLRYQAMGLRKWGRETEADEIYDEVVQYYLDQAKAEKEKGALERQALSLEEAAKVLSEYGDENKAKQKLESAMEIYHNMAKDASEADDPEEASKFYSKAAEGAGKLGDSSRKKQYHELASSHAEDAATFYADVDVDELATIWKRTAGEEALKTESPDMIDKGIELLDDAAKGFQQSGEFKEAFDDFYTVFLAIYFQKPEDKHRLNDIIEAMNDIALNERNPYYSAMVSVLRAVIKPDKIGALLAFQEQEEDLKEKRESLRKLIEAVEMPDKSDEETGKDSTHWLYK